MCYDSAAEGRACQLGNSKEGSRRETSHTPHGYSRGCDAEPRSPHDDHGQTGSVMDGKDMCQPSNWLRFQPHMRLTDRFTDARRIIGIILLSLHIGLDKLRPYQPDHMAKSFHFSQFVARPYWLKNGTCPRCCRAHHLKRRRPQRGLHMHIDTNCNQLQIPRN